MMREDEEEVRALGRNSYSKEKRKRELEKALEHLGDTQQKLSWGRSATEKKDLTKAEFPPQTQQ